VRLSRLKTAAVLVGLSTAAMVLVFVIRPWNSAHSDAVNDAPHTRGPSRCGMRLDGPHSEMEDWGPYSFYPVSFPKILGGFLYFEEKRPALAVTRSQCAALIPVLEEMGADWAKAIELNEEMKLLLTPEQVQFVLEHKSELERPVNMVGIQEHLRRILGTGDGPARGDFFQEFCRRRAASGPHDPDYPRSDGDALITATDISSGLVLLEVEGDPESRLTPYQAAELNALFRRYFQYNQRVQSGFCDGVMTLVTDDQFEGVKQDIKEIISYKKVIFETDTGTFQQDPLFDRVIEMCRQKL